MLTIPFAAPLNRDFITRTTGAILSGIDKNVTAVVLLDMSKAFDSISHEILLNKLQDIGISSFGLASFDMFNSYLYYLKDTRSSVEIRNLSEPLPVESGFPQSSIQGSLLFSFYVKATFGWHLTLYNNNNNNNNAVCTAQIS